MTGHRTDAVRASASRLISGRSRGRRASGGRAAGTGAALPDARRGAPTEPVAGAGVERDERPGGRTRQPERPPVRGHAARHELPAALDRPPGFDLPRRGVQHRHPGGPDRVEGACVAAQHQRGRPRRRPDEPDGPEVARVQQPDAARPRVGDGELRAVRHQPDRGRPRPGGQRLVRDDPSAPQVHQDDPALARAGDGEQRRVRREVGRAARAGERDRRPRLRPGRRDVHPPPPRGHHDRGQRVRREVQRPRHRQPPDDPAHHGLQRPHLTADPPAPLIRTRQEAATA
ncbi:hypothetical protein AB0J52_22080 [Spirillospora sp. NPDC049652]